MVGFMVADERICMILDVYCSGLKLFASFH